MKSCTGIEKKRSGSIQSVDETVTDSKESRSTSRSSYESSSSGAASSSPPPPPPPSSILGWPIRKASFRKNSKENVVVDSGSKQKTLNIAG